MAQTRNPAFLLALALTVSVVGHGAPRPALLADGPPIYPLASVERGQRGEGYTVFASADGPQRFEFTVLGVMRDYLGPGEDLVVARLEGALIERTGVIAGMSGSPAFIDGKLVGAVGYRFGAFTKDPIAGITPIERMLATGDRAPARTARVSTDVTAAAQWGEAKPIAVPLVVSGLAPSVRDAFVDELAARGYGPVIAGGAGGRAAPTGERLYAGGPIAGLLVNGDTSMAAIGTVTWVKGDRFLAFGHPFRGTGWSTVPVASAEIVTTVASEAGSWKMGQATGVVGRLTDDRLHAIAGDLGVRAPTVPVTFRLTTDAPRRAADPSTTVALEILADREDAPLFSAISLANTLSSRVSAEDGGTVTIDGKATLSSGDEVAIQVREAVAGSQAVFILAAVSVLGQLNEVIDHDFAEVELVRLDLDVKVSTAVSLARVVGVDTIAPLTPGEAGQVRVRLRPHQGGVVDRVLPVTLPPSLRPGQYTLFAVDARGAMRVESETGMTKVPTRFADLLARSAARPSASEVSLYLVADATTVRLDGESLPGLPPSLAGLVGEGGGLSGSLVDERAIPLGRVELGHVVQGEVRGKIQVAAAEERR